MKGKLIMQKISLAVSMVAITFCGFMMWSVYSAQQQSQQFNSSMLDKIENLVATSKQQPTQTSTEKGNWTSFKLRLVSGTKDGPPIVGQTVRCMGHFLGASEEHLRKTSDKDGFVDFGNVQTDSYSVTIIMPWGEWLFDHKVRVTPTYETETIVCPVNTDYRKMEITLDVPNDLQKEELSYLINGYTLGPDPNEREINLQPDQTQTRTVNNFTWSIDFFKKSDISNLLFDSKGILCKPVVGDYVKLDRMMGEKEVLLKPDKNYFLETTTIKKCDRIVVFDGKLTTSISKLRLNSFLNPTRENAIFIGPLTPEFVMNWGINEHSGSDATGFIGLPEISDEKNPVLFDPKKNESSDWKIKLKDEFWEGVRKTMKVAREKAKDAPKPVAQEGFGGGLF
jgi:hypothetical protein